MDFKIKPEKFFLILKLNLKDSFESYDCIYQYVKEKKKRKCHDLNKISNNYLYICSSQGIPQWSDTVNQVQCSVSKALISTHTFFLQHTGFPVTLRD